MLCNKLVYCQIMQRSVEANPLWELSFFAHDSTFYIELSQLCQHSKRPYPAQKWLSCGHGD